MKSKRLFTRCFQASAWLLLILFLAAPASAVILDDENKIDVVLSDGTKIVLYGEATKSAGQKSNKYYYMPVNLRLSPREDGTTPSFLFLKFTTEERANQGGVSGALMHFLMEWGLTPDQDAELRSKLEEEHENAELMGAVSMMPEGETGSFQIVSGTLSDEGMTRSLVTSGKAPTVPGGKVAVASRLDAHGAQLLASTFEKSRSIADVSIACNFTYTTLAPAARGRITFNWSKYESSYESFKAEYERKRTGTRKKKFLGITIWSSPTYSYSYDEMREHYDMLIEKEVVKLEFDELIADERVATIRDAFFQYFLNTFAEPAESDVPPPPPSDEEKEKSPNIRYGNRYKFTKTFVERSFKQKTKRFDLNAYRLAIRWPFQLVGNLASWYDGVRDNPKCVAAINLNDPFFQHRDIHFILDLDAKEVFDETINYVTVNVRKKRSSGNDFSDRVTIDKKFLEKNGITASMTYARGEDTHPDVYEYQAQWSLRGGLVYPENPQWLKGSWEGVTLSMPVVPRTIEFEADLDELEENGITRVTAQIHYQKFGEEVEENIHVSPAKKEPLVERKIFLDQEARGYACRLVFNHKTEGKLALPWGAQVSDDYIYATIPEELLDTESDVFKTAKEAAENVINSAEEKVLDKFEELFGGK